MDSIRCGPVKIAEDTKFIVLDDDDDDDMDPTVLECDYEIKDTDSFLTVKWFRNDKTIYQWIRGSHPAPIPEYKNDVDSSYESSIDPNKQYSALALINPSISSTGDYKCVVQTSKETITIHKSVQVIDVRNYTLNMYRYQIQNETQLECVVTNVFPKPTLSIVSDDDDDIVKVVANDPIEDENGYFNATIFAVVQDNDDDVDYHKCLVTFEGYSQNLTTVITSGSSNFGNIKLVSL
ncbi:GH21689 [Drosophila grimshawi]|uniref:GH21689 n=1 Tax=Drosophila grimshawi TaxID=7222 RepID=B4J639_DROGR|nr:GH21689 [Drosophila grimshawi]